MKSVCVVCQKNLFVASLMVLMALAGLSGCSKKPVAEARPLRPPVPVLVVRAEVRDVPVRLQVVPILEQ